MKILKIVSGILIASVLIISNYQPVNALSCVYPDEQYAQTRLAEESEGVIVVADVIETKQVRNYTGVKLQVNEVIKGYSVPTEMWAYYRIDDTWGYLCAGNPIQVGHSAVFDLYVEDGVNFVSHGYDLEGDSNMPAREVFLDNVKSDFEFMDKTTRFEDLRNFGEELMTRLLLIINELTN